MSFIIISAYASLHRRQCFTQGDPHTACASLRPGDDEKVVDLEDEKASTLGSKKPVDDED